MLEEEICGNPFKTEMPLDITTYQEALPYSPFTTTTKGVFHTVFMKLDDVSSQRFGRLSYYFHVSEMITQCFLPTAISL
jgi:hypothetical protein